MSRNTKIVMVAVVALIAIGGVAYYLGSVKTTSNPVIGTYRETYLQITLKSDKTFYFYNSISNTSVTGSYTYSLSDDNSKAYVSFKISSGNFSYDGAVIYFNYGSVLCPTINGSEVVARQMDKIR